MFKKPPQVKPAANIKSSDRRKLLSTVCKTYNLPIDEIAKQGLDNLVPPISKKATFTSPIDKKLTGTIYFDSDEIPTWFQTRDSQLYPSLFTCWKCPYILPLVKTHEPVIGVLGKGADLMLPGTIPPFDVRATKNAIVGIVSKEKPNVIMAVGVCRLNLTQFDYVVGRSGMAVEIIHHFDDELMKLNKEIDVVVPDNVDPEIPKVANDGEEVANEEEKESEQKEEKPVAESQDTESGTTGDTKTDIDDVAEELAQLTTDEVDNFFIRSLLQTIKLENFQLPINSSSFMSLYIYKNLPVLDPTYANIKKTSWKKTSKFLKAMAKLSYLEVKGKDEDLSIIKLMSRSNPTIENFVPHKINKVKKPTSAGSDGNGGSSSSSSSSSSTAMKITNLYKPTSKSRMFFNKLDAEFDHLYTLPELRTMFNDYIKSANLVNPKNPKQIIVDEVISKPTNKPIDAQVARDEIFATFLTNFTPHYSIKDNNNSNNVNVHDHIAKGTPPKIRIVTEMKIGRKVITRVGNYDKFFIKQGAFAEELRKLCSGSTTIVDDEQVQVQGPHGNTIINLLKEKGVPLGCIEFEDKVKKKKRK